MRPVHLAVLVMALLLLVFQHSSYVWILSLIVIATISYQIGDRFFFSKDNKKDRS